MIYIVSGFFRSGTSLLMQSLEAGGLPIYYSRKRDRLNEEHTDRSRRPNPVSLYEPSGSDLAEIGFPRRHDGCAVKVLIMWLSSLAVHDYRVLMLYRDPLGIMDSYERAFHEFWDLDRREAWIRYYYPRMDETYRWFLNRRDVRSVSRLAFADVLSSPLVSFRSLAADGWPIDAERAASVVTSGKALDGTSVPCPA